MTKRSKRQRPTKATTTSSNNQPLDSLMDAQQDKAAPAEPKVIVEKTGAEVALGDIITDFRGEKATLISFRPPHQAGSTGRVYVEMLDGSGKQLLYPTVYGLKIVMPEVL